VFNHGKNLSIFKFTLKVKSELVVSQLNRNAVSLDYQNFLMKVNPMNRLISRAAVLVRSAFTQDVSTQRALEANYVQVAMTSRHWGA
jgi:hypothetical protein